MWPSLHWAHSQHSSLLSSSVLPWPSLWGEQYYGNYGKTQIGHVSWLWRHPNDPFGSNDSSVAHRHSTVLTAAHCWAQESMTSTMVMSGISLMDPSQEFPVHLGMVVVYTCHSSIRRLSQGNWDFKDKSVGIDYLKKNINKSKCTPNTHTHKKHN